MINLQSVVVIEDIIEAKGMFAREMRLSHRTRTSHLHNNKIVATIMSVFGQIHIHSWLVYCSIVNAHNIFDEPFFQCTQIDAPHHVRVEERSKYREGVVLEKKGTGPDAGSLVNCGIRARPVE
jgi:hypothetical protein